MISSDFNSYFKITPFDRDLVAERLLSDLQSLGISFKGKSVIDIGCRSGENSLAMQNAGAEVIGIDPNDKEFGTAEKKGMKRSQLVKATLQQYQALHPIKKFDIATVFLWNIPHQEVAPFVTALKKIIRIGGQVIIGYADEAYQKILPALMRSKFDIVVEKSFTGSVNKGALICGLKIEKETLQKLVAETDNSLRFARFEKKFFEDSKEWMSQDSKNTSVKRVHEIAQDTFKNCDTISSILGNELPCSETEETVKKVAEMRKEIAQLKLWVSLHDLCTWQKINS